MKKEICRVINVSADTKIQQNQLNFEVFEEEIIGISGLNDSSYSYTAEVLLSRNAITNGVISGYVHETQIGAISSKNNWGLYDQMSVVENICDLAGTRHYMEWSNTKSDRKKATEILSSMGKEELLSQKIQDMSNNEKMIIAVAKQVYQQKKIIVLDKIIISLTKETKLLAKCFYEMVRTYKCAMIIVSNHLEMLKSFCDKIYLIRNGYTVFCMESRNFNNKYVLEYQKKKVNEIKEQLCESTRKEILMQISGRSADGEGFVLSIYEGKMNGILELGRLDYGYIRQCIMEDDREGGGRFAIKAEINKALKIVYYNDEVHKYYYPDMSLAENICMSALDNICVGKRFFISKKMERVALEEFLKELEEFNIPAANGKKSTYKDLTLEQKTVAAFFRLRLSNPDLLIIEGKLILEKKLIMKLINKFLRQSTTILVIDSDQYGILQYCSNCYAFVNEQYLGSMNQYALTEDFTIC